jgi:hypothetical protein
VRVGRQRAGLVRVRGRGRGLGGDHRPRAALGAVAGPGAREVDGGGRGGGGEDVDLRDVRGLVVGHVDEAAPHQIHLAGVGVEHGRVEAEKHLEEEAAGGARLLREGARSKPGELAPETRCVLEYADELERLVPRQEVELLLGGGVLEVGEVEVVGEIGPACAGPLRAVGAESGGPLAEEPRDRGDAGGPGAGRGALDEVSAVFEVGERDAAVRARDTALAERVLDEVGAAVCALVEQRHAVERGGLRHGLCAGPEPITEDGDAALEALPIAAEPEAHLRGAGAAPGRVRVPAERDVGAGFEYGEIRGVGEVAGGVAVLVEIPARRGRLRAVAGGAVGDEIEAALDDQRVDVVAGAELPVERAGDERGLREDGDRVRGARRDVLVRPAAGGRGGGAGRHEGEDGLLGGRDLLFCLQHIGVRGGARGRRRRGRRGQRRRGGAPEGQERLARRFAVGRLREGDRGVLVGGRGRRERGSCERGSRERGSCERGSRERGSRERGSRERGSQGWGSRGGRRGLPDGGSRQGGRWCVPGIRLEGEAGERGRRRLVHGARGRARLEGERGDGRSLLCVERDSERGEARRGRGGGARLRLLDVTRERLPDVRRSTLAADERGGVFRERELLLGLLVALLQVRVGELERALDLDAGGGRVGRGLATRRRRNAGCALLPLHLHGGHDAGGRQRVLRRELQRLAEGEGAPLLVPVDAESVRAEVEQGALRDAEGAQPVDPGERARAGELGADDGERGVQALQEQPLVAADFIEALIGGGRLEIGEVEPLRDLRDRPLQVAAGRGAEEAAAGGPAPPDGAEAARHGGIRWMEDGGSLGAEGVVGAPDAAGGALVDDRHLREAGRILEEEALVEDGAPVPEDSEADGQLGEGAPRHVRLAGEDHVDLIDARGELRGEADAAVRELAVVDVCRDEGLRRAARHGPVVHEGEGGLGDDGDAEAPPLPPRNGTRHRTWQGED